MSFGADTVLDKVSFSVHEGDRLGVVGENGAGKTSLLRILAGEYDHLGNVFIQKDRSLGMLSQLSGVGDGTVYEELLSAFSGLKDMEKEMEEYKHKIELHEYCGIPSPEGLINSYTSLLEKYQQMGGEHYENRVRSYLIHLGFPEDTWQREAKGLSGGERTRLALGRLLLANYDILLLDEPTNHLDIQTIVWLEDVLANSRSTVIAVSHDRYFLDRVANKILDIEYGTAKLYSGNYSSFVKQKETDRDIQRRHYENQQKQIAKMEAFIEQQKRWNREKNIIAAESRRKAIERIEKIEAPRAESRPVRIKFESGSESGNDVLTVKGLSAGYGKEPLFSDVSFLIKKGDRAFITGKNGSGKSTLMKLLRGKVRPISGSVVFGYNTTVGYYDQENQELDPEKTVFEELSDAAPAKTVTEVRSALALFLFKGDDVLKKVCVLSGGEKARLTLAKLILQSHNVLLLDEPTNHLDIKSREALEGALDKYEGTLIAVSHDRYFVKRLATRMLDISEKPFLDYMGGYEDYMEHMPQRQSDAVKEKPKAEAKARYLQDKEAKSERRRLTSLIARLKKEEEDIEKRSLEIDVLYKENEYDYKKLMELDEERQKLEERLFEIWQTVEQSERQLSDTES